MSHNHSHIGTGLETLEDRRMFSVTNVNGLVKIEGTNNPETVTVSEFTSNSELSLGVRFLQIKETTHRSFLPDITRTTNIEKSKVSRLRVNSFGGADVITLNTTIGADVFAGAGSDRVTGGSGNDNIFGDASILSDFDGHEIGPGFIGTAGKDLLLGGAGNDLLNGNGGDDSLVGGAGSDRMFGEAGNDFINAKDGRAFETVDGGSGVDTAVIDILSQVANIRDTTFSIERVTT